jgi:K+-transporting ATPase A subunit
MSQPNFKSSDDSPILGISIAVVAILVFLLSWRVGSYISLQNTNLDASIQNMKRQVEQGQPLVQNFARFRDTLMEYVKQTQDINVVRLLAAYGVVQVQQQAPQQGQPAAPGAAQAPAQPAAPAAQPAR